MRTEFPEKPIGEWSKGAGHSVVVLLRSIRNGQTFSRPSSLRYLIGVFTKNTSPGGAALPHAGAGRPRGVMEEKTPSSP